MRRLALLLSAIVLLSAVQAAAAPTPPTGPFVPRGPIFIRNDAEFTAANGVVSGAGTPANPYVIAGWHIVSSSTAVLVRNVSAHYVIRDNLIEAYWGVWIEAQTAQGVVRNNQIHASMFAIHVREADPVVRDNSIYLTGGSTAARGIYALWSNAQIRENYMVASQGTGIEIDRATPTVVGNDIHNARIGILALSTSQATIDANIITNPAVHGIKDVTTIANHIDGNLVTTSGFTGIEAWGSKDIWMGNNTVRYSASTGVLFESVSGAFYWNHVLDGHQDGVRIWHSPLFMHFNRIETNLGIGFHFSMSAADAHANTLVRNGMGIALHGADVIHLRDNVLVNNTVGISIPYASRQSIPHLVGNYVNGVNVDGAHVPAQRVFHYMAANVTLVGGSRDSGFSAGYYGSLTAQGGLVLYDVNTALINGTRFANHNIGIGIVNSFNVQIHNARIVNNWLGIKAEAIAAPFQVPACVVFVKDSNVTLDIDPIGFVGIESRGCGTFIANTTVSIVDIGIRYAGLSYGSIVDSRILNTRTGMELTGREELEITGNLVAGNRIGARFLGASALVQDNRFLANTQAAARMELGASVRLHRNDITDNGVGFVDTRACAGAWTCASVSTDANRFERNRGDALVVNGSATLRGDVFLYNLGTGARLASPTILGVQASHNKGDGIAVTGTFTLRDSAFHWNGAYGFRLVGSGDMRNSSFTHNTLAGIRATATYVTAYNLNVSYNFDGILFDEAVPPVVLPSAPNAWALVPSPSWGGNQDPLDIHRSIIVGNERDAIRAGAAIVNATHNYWGGGAPRTNVADTIGAWQNGISPHVRFIPYFRDPAMTQTGPVNAL